MGKCALAGMRKLKVLDMKAYSLPALLLMAFCCTLTVGPASAARIRAFVEPDYRGAETVFREAQPNLQAAHSMTIASLRVVTGRWLICAGSDFTGDCAWISRDIASLTNLGFTNQPGSVRPEIVPVILRNWGNRRPAARTTLVLFEHANYDGGWTALSDSLADFGTKQVKSPGSIVLNEGAWRLCTAPDYAGRCLIATASAWDLANIFPGAIRSAQRLQ